MESQQTIAESVSVAGRGLFGGQQVELTFKPAPANHGVVFARTDLDGARVPANIRYVVDSPRRTCLANGDARIETCEHCLSALAGLGVDNTLIELNAPELPALDGSARPYLDALESVGLSDTGQPRKVHKINEPVMVEADGAMVAAMPLEAEGLEIVYSLEYPDRVVGRQMRGVRISRDEYKRELAPARTFVLETEARSLRSQGMGKHLTPEDMLVIGDDGPLGNNELRFDDEPVRHKILDLLGDIYLLGVPVRGRLLASKSGHALNHALARKLSQQMRSSKESLSTTLLDTRKLSRILPHRFPMLLVDRVIEIEGDRLARGIKNVTINEPFFQGHYPGTPIMPGVLIVEAMAQLAGVLIGQNLEHTGKLPVLLSLDGVKLRKPVTPGDQLVLEAESIRMRQRIAHMRCRALLGSDVAAEAEVKFMLVDDEDE
ncbi:MAG: UDP-3-O-acyl-N-acetylglucosamine deacetylase [Phycisphaeraceae bacterium]|nr:UDP-3-O-acyl-N-acetylglucosamine deacetylase [Phycisphaeraceae bacterium]